MDGQVIPLSRAPLSVYEHLTFLQPMKPRREAKGRDAGHLQAEAGRPWHTASGSAGQTALPCYQGAAIRTQPPAGLGTRGGLWPFGASDFSHIEDLWQQNQTLNWPPVAFRSGQGFSH